MKIHITGASGTGTTTLGKALAAELSYRHLDADSYYWLPTTPPFKEKRPAEDRYALLEADITSANDVILSGSIVGWGQQIEDGFDRIVFLYLPAPIRVARLEQREIELYGAADPAFLSWAAMYDEGPVEGRSLAKHEAWLAARGCPVLRLDQDQTISERIAAVQEVLRKNELV